MTKPFVALDTTIVMILAGKRSGEKDALARAQELVEYHKSRGEFVTIPAAALAECCHCKDELWSSLTVLPLNAAAAILANQLFPAAQEILKKKPRRGVTRQALKFDSLILATAERAGAAVLYTTDAWFAKVAAKNNLRIRVEGLPPLNPKQHNLPNPPSP